MSTVESKRILRQEMLKLRMALSEQEVREKSFLIKEKLFGLSEFKEAGLIMFYVSFKNEVRTEEMIEEAMAAGKRIALPVTTSTKEIKPYLVFDLKKDLVPGRYGIPEPRIDRNREVEAREIDLIVVPGLAFDRRGYRLGFGAGYYDRFLRSLYASQPRPFCFGLAYEFQVVPLLPSEGHDEKLDMVITEKHIYQCRSAQT